METATVRRNATDTAVGNGIAGTIKTLPFTVELAASASGTTIDFGKVPSSARLLHSSQLYWDDLATSGSPTLDVGVDDVNGNITADPDAINDGLALSSASTGSRLIKDHANAGKRVWEIMGLTSDPGGEIMLQGVVKDAATNAAGTISGQVDYTVD